METQMVITGKDLIMDTLKELDAIQVPVSLLNVLGPHLGRAYNNMQLLYQAMSKKEAENENQKEEASAEEFPELEVIEGGNEDAEKKDQLEGTVQE